MQTLYSIESMNNETRAGEPLQILNKKMEHSQQLITYLIYYIIEVTRYAEKDAHKRAGKHLPTHEDLNVNIKIAGNEIIWTTLENQSFRESAEKFKIKYMVDEDMVRKSYLALIATPEYKEYIATQSRDKKSEKSILEFIFSDIMLENEDFISDVEGKFIHWDDDAETIISLMNGYFQKPGQFNFTGLVGEEKMEFAVNLLKTVLEKNDYCLEIIKPKLKNWDSERIAALDMILMKMGLCEFLYFDTIPTKVTINEYIDLAKEYSTEQSGHFINGILDNIHKELLADNKISKINFKNSTL